MIKHLDGHPHAFLNSKNEVTDIFVFDGHDHDLIQQVKEHISATDVKCCCDLGQAYKPGDFYNGKFYPQQPFPSWLRDEENSIWIAPILYPNDGEFYIWDENTVSWLLLPPSN